MTDHKTTKPRRRNPRRWASTLSNRLDVLRKNMAHVMPVAEDEQAATAMIDAVLDVARQTGLVDEFFEAIALADILAANPVLAPTQLIRFAEPFGIELLVQRLSPGIAGH